MSTPGVENLSALRYGIASEKIASGIHKRNARAQRSSMRGAAGGAAVAVMEVLSGVGDQDDAVVGAMEAPEQRTAISS
jgi:hypothetical protein